MFLSGFEVWKFKATPPLENSKQTKKLCKIWGFYTDLFCSKLEFRLSELIRAGRAVTKTWVLLFCVNGLYTEPRWKSPLIWTGSERSNGGSFVDEKTHDKIPWSDPSRKNAPTDLFFFLFFLDTQHTTSNTILTYSKRNVGNNVFHWVWEPGHKKN